MRAGYQGEPGAFSEQAVRTLLPEAEPVPHRTFGSVFEAVVSGDLRYGVVPIENSQAGSINDTYDLLARHHLWIGGEVSVRVDQALLALPGTRLEDVRRVSSHPQALAQSAEFLAALDAEVVPEYDTAGAARRIAEQRLAGEAAVASERAAELYGLEVLARRIQTHGENHTRFVAIAVDRTPLGEPDKTSLVFGVGHRPGALYRSLRPFAERDLNLSKLESRPLGDSPWRYRFYLDVEAADTDPALIEALAELERETSFVRVLGSYPAWREPPA